MPRIIVDWDEAYPVFVLYPEGTPTATGVTAEVPDAQLADWQRALADYERVQEEMRAVSGWDRRHEKRR